MKAIANFLTFSLAGLIGVGAVAGLSYAYGINYAPAIQEEQPSDVSLETEIKEEGLKIRKLSTTTEGNNVITTLSYQITAETDPDYDGSIDERVEAKTYYQKSHDPADDVIAVDIDQINKLIKITNLNHEPFGDVVVVEVSSVADPNVKALISCNYRKRLTDITLGTLDYNVGENVNLISKILENSNENNVTAFTLDTDFTRSTYQALLLSSLKNINLNTRVLEGDETIGTGSWEDFNADMSGYELIANTLATFIEQTQKTFNDTNTWTDLSNCFLTAAEVWELGDDTWHDFIKNYCNGSFKIGFTLEGATINEPLTGSVTAGNTTNYINLKYDFSAFGIAPDNITIESGEVNF